MFSIKAVVHLIFVLILSSTCSVADGIRTDPIEVAERLRDGGYVVFMRSPHTGATKKNGDASDLKNCGSQKNLTDNGEEVAREIGGAAKALRIIFAPVKTSAYCRAWQTAVWMGYRELEISADLNNSETLPENRLKTLAVKLGEMFRTSPEKGRNTLLIGHSKNLGDLDSELLSFGFNPADMLVFKPGKTKGGYELVARITPDGWRILTAELAIKVKSVSTTGSAK